MVTTVSFPGLGLEFELNRVAFSIGGFNVYWYGLLIGIGFMLAGTYALLNARKVGVDSDRLIDVVMVGLVCGVIGARLYYVIFYLDLYRNADGSLNWGDMIAVWDGGLAIYGAVIAALIVVFFYTRHKKLPFFAMTDLGAMGLLLGQIIGRWANFINREAFGGLTDLPWRMRLWVSSSQYIEVHPTFLYESLWNLAGLGLLLFVISKGRRFDGENTWFYFLWYGLGRFWIEGLRTDSLYLFNWTIGGQPIRVSQALSLVMVFVSLFMLYYHIKLHPHKPEELYVNIVAARNAAAAEAAAAPAAESPAQATPTADASAEAVSSETEAPSQEEPSGETPTEDPS